MKRFRIGKSSALKAATKEGKAGAVAKDQQSYGGRGAASSGKTNNSSANRVARHIVIAQKIGVTDILEEMIQRAQEQQDS